MSAFIVQQETINKCVQALLPEGASCESADHLGTQLLGLNYLAMKYRYGEPFPDTLKFFYRNKGYTYVQKYKAIQCLLYQCTEGDLPDNVLYKKLVQASHDLARIIVVRLPEYNQAPWE